jgi:hypothetical protein
MAMTMSLGMLLLHQMQQKMRRMQMETMTLMISQMQQTPRMAQQQ